MTPQYFYTIPATAIFSTTHTDKIVSYILPGTRQSGITISNKKLQLFTMQTTSVSLISYC